MRVGAGVMLRDPLGRALLCRRTADGFWATPGGLREPGEPAEVTAVRELAEETGVRLHPSDLSLGIATQPTPDLIYVVFEARVVPYIIPGLDHEHDDWGWFFPRALPAPLHPGLRRYPW